MVDLQTKFEALATGMKARLIERDEEIEIFQLALLARTHAFLQGEPGIAKSLLVEVGIALIDGLEPDDYFHILFMKSTTREDVFGPLALSLLKQDRYKYVEAGFLPAAKIVFGDEFWKANGAIQNALLWATNERLYRNDGKVQTIPLHTMIIASNEFPDSDELLAIYDRFPLRRVVRSVVEPGAFINMLKVSGGPKTHGTVITWDEIEQACLEVEQVKIPGDVLEALSDVREQLREKSIYPSDRRFVQSLAIVRAAAWMNGESEADVSDLRVLRHVLWTDPESFPAVDELLTGMSNPLDLEIMKIQEDLSKLSREVDAVCADQVDEEMRQRTGAQIYEKIESAKDELKDIAGRSKGTKRRSAKLHPATEQVMTLTNRLLVKVFGTTEEQIAKGLEEFVEEIHESGGDDV